MTKETTNEPNPNMRLWERVYMTDPKAVKPITGKDYGGNSPKPYWIIQRLTEEFGPCGLGWGYTIENERFERFSDTDTLHVAKVRLWYEMDGKRGEVVQMGQTKATYMTGNGKFKVDEDAPKKSVTDALVKCASYIGFAGDIFSGRWDDSKYVAEARKHYEGERDITKSGTLQHAVRDGIGDDLPDDDKQYLLELAAWSTKHVGKGDALKVAQHIAAEKLEADQRVYLENQMDSKTRSAIKKAEEEIRKTMGVPA